MIYIRCQTRAQVKAHQVRFRGLGYRSYFTQLAEGEYMVRAWRG